MHSLPVFFLLTLIALTAAAAQLCLKRGAILRGTGALCRSFFQPWVLAGILLTGLNTVGLSLLLRKLPLTIVMPVTALVYIFVPLGAWLFFSERVKPRFWVGVTLIMTGIAIINHS